MASVLYKTESFQLCDDFLLFKERLEHFFMLNNVDVTKDDVKRNHLLAALSIEAYKLLKNLCAPKTCGEITYEKITY